MKKLTLALAAFCLLLLASCGLAGSTVEVYRAVSPYYLTGGAAIESERVSVDTSLGDIDAAVAAFNTDTSDPELVRALPEGVNVTGWELVGSELRLSVSPEYAALTGHRRTIADACAVFTFCAIDGVESVSIYSEGVLLTAATGPDAYVLDAGG